MKTSINKGKTLANVNKPPAVNIFHVDPAIIANIKCPAVKLAANRTPNVIALAAYETNSINTKNGAKNIGAPAGINIAKKFNLKFCKLNIIHANHILKLRPNVTII